MAKKQSSKRRTQVKELPRKVKQLSAKDKKGVKGGGATFQKYKIEEAFISSSHAK